MVNDMGEYIDSQQSVLNNIIENELVKIERCADGIDLDNIEKILLIGSGTSYNVGIAVKNIFEHLLKKEVLVEYPFPLRKYSSLLDGKDKKSTLAIAISQSGKSTGTIECIEKSKNAGMKTACLTSNIDSEISKKVDFVIPVMCGDEKVGPKTKGYTATLLTLQVLALYLSRKAGLVSENWYNCYLGQIKSAISNMNKIIKESHDWFNKNIDWNKAASIFIVGYGPNMGTALEGGLKLLETFRRPVLSYDIEEYIHGPYNALGVDTHIIFIDSMGSGSNMMKKLVPFVEGITNHYLVISFDSDDYLDEHRINIPRCDEYISPIVCILPFQVIACEIAKSIGIDPGIPRYTNFHDLMGSKKGLVDFN